MSTTWEHGVVREYLVKIKCKEILQITMGDGGIYKVYLALPYVSDNTTGYSKR